MADDKIIDKLAKMIRHEQSARAIGSIAEAEAFASQIQEWLSRHKLEMSDIQWTEQESAEPIDDEYVLPKDAGLKWESKRVRWQENLASAIARSNDCQTLISNSSNVSYFVGRKSDREICAALFKYFCGLIIEMSEKAALEAKGSEREKLKARMSWYSGADLRWHMRDFRVSFCRGMSIAIQERLLERRRAFEATLKSRESDQSNALIHLRDTSEAISSYLEELFKDRKPRQAKENFQQTGHVREAYHAGVKAGESVALTSGALHG